MAVQLDGAADEVCTVPGDWGDEPLEYCQHRHTPSDEVPQTE